jgi:hypothetical protein
MRTAHPADRETQLRRLLRSVAARLDDVKRRKSSATREEAADFTPFDYINVDENRISRILANLLNPRGSHGQGVALLEDFFASVGLDSVTGLHRASVECECETVGGDTRRRIDIVIRGDEWVVGIENKPWAIDQLNQISEYISHLRTRGQAHYCLLYLSHDGRRPSEQSIDSDNCTALIDAGTLRCVSYERVVSWLRRCLQISRAPRLRFFLEAFADCLERLVLSRAPFPEQEMVIESILNPERPEDLVTALELFQMKDAVREALQRTLMRHLETQLPAGWVIHHDLSREGILGIKMSKASSWHFRVESENRGSGQRHWWYGIRHDPSATAEQTKEVEQLCASLRGRLSEDGPPIPGYTPFWRWFQGRSEHEPKEYLAWETSVVPWLDMHSGKMAENLLCLAEELNLDAQKVAGRPR